MKLRKVGDEVVRAILAEVFHRLSSSRRDVCFPALRFLLESGGNVRELKLDVLGVVVDPLSVTADYEDGGVADLGVRRKFGKDVHNLRHDLVVAGIDLCSHRAHREQGSLDVLPFDNSSA